MRLNEEQVQFLKIMESLGYEFDETKETKGIEVNLFDKPFNITVEDILNSKSYEQEKSSVKSYSYINNNESFTNDKNVKYHTIVSNKVYYTEEISNESIEKVAI
ncbi:hypothetical protein [Mammaliicoccus sciuri]|uniref:hypothetical protein n=1 Tax=Mammaliicoccus sciuri TaxID=1296 RepID=UPI001FB4EE1E|nr:hypothetical protein [Mammaliicoccus sciuri]MCJ0939169.1 hypothetical protein [Mammaliicoccus sciuri]